MKTTWVYRIDADEVVTPELGEEIVFACKEHQNDDVNGFVMKFRIAFMGTFLKHGGMYPFYNLTIFKFGKGRYENRAMGEHVILSEGKSLDLKNDCLHYDFKSLDSLDQQAQLVCNPRGRRLFLYPHNRSSRPQYLISRSKEDQ